MSIEDEITALNLFMEELTDTVEICRHRPEIVLDQIDRMTRQSSGALLST